MNVTTILFIWLCGLLSFSTTPCAINHNWIVSTTSTSRALSICIESDGEYRLSFEKDTQNDQIIEALFALPEAPVLLGALRQSVGDPILKRVGLYPKWEGKRMIRQLLNEDIQSERYALNEGLELVLLVDLKSGRFLGCSIYKDQNWLLRKLVLEYGNKPSGQLQTATLSIIETTDDRWHEGVYHFQFDQ